MREEAISATVQAAKALREITDILADAQSRAADLERTLEQVTAKEETLRAENRQILARLATLTGE